MQVSVESTSKLERRMQVQVPAERVTQEIASRLKTLSRTARLNGFRPGKAPLNVIRRQFGVQVHREVIGELLQSSFAEAVSANKLVPAGNPRIEPQSVDEGQDLRYTATFEVLPEFVLQPTESLEIEAKVASVEPADVDAMLERLRKQQLRYTPVSRAAGVPALRSISTVRSTRFRSRAGRVRTSPSFSARAGCCASSRKVWSVSPRANRATSR